MNYNEHFLLNTATAKQYVIDKTSIFPNTKAEDLESVELSDGNINYVYRVFNKNKSVIVKQSDNKIRTSGRALDVGRSQIEFKILSIERQLAGDVIPEVYDYDKNMSVIIMEDISAYKNLRSELARGKTFSELADEVSDFLVASLLPTTDLILDRHQKKQRVKEFVNIELCDITEDLVLTEPYYNYKGRNIFDPSLKSFVEQNLYSNSELKANVGMLRNNFMNNAQALLHGDLHSGSIFVNHEGIKVIDPEFAFYGPMGYDIGNVIGNLIFHYIIHLEKCLADGLPEDSFTRWIEKTIASIFDLTFIKMEARFDEMVSFPLYRERKFKNKYLASVAADSLGFAGTEVIRRTIGDSKVSEINAIDDDQVRNSVSRVLVKSGINLVLNRNDYTKGSQIVQDLYDITADEVLGGVLIG